METRRAETDGSAGSPIMLVMNLFAVKIFFFIGRLNVKLGGQKQMARPILLLNRLLWLICELFENGNDCDFLWKEQRSQFNKVLLLLVNFYGENGNEFV